VLERELGRVQVPVRVLEMAPVSALGLVPAREQAQALGQVPVLASVRNLLRRYLKSVTIPRGKQERTSYSFYSST